MNPNIIFAQLISNAMNYSIKRKICSVACIAAASATVCNGKNDRPNILWLTFEDTSQYEFGSYGNPDAITPVTDSIAKCGIRFVNAYSCGPQSSPARSALITGCWSTTYAMDWHRKRVKTPEDIFFPQILRNAGYWCTNNQKTDYNSTVDNNSCWDECSDNASYNSVGRKAGQPFFAVFNSNLTHMSRLTSVHIDGRRDFAKEGQDPQKLELPPYVPDLDAVRSDYAFHLEGVADVDKWVGIFLNDLKDKGLDDNTIVFVFSDHGGCLPRGKAFAYESSYRVPMFVYLPKKWKCLSNEKTGVGSDRLVSFCDMAPTVLSLAGIKPPEWMQGVAFMGKYEGPERERQIGYMTNRTIHFAPSRSISDGKFKYTRNYIPYKRDALFNYFQWQMPANLAWDKGWQEGILKPEHQQPYLEKTAEAFFDLENDPFELNNLINDKRYSKLISQFRTELSEYLRNSMDIGLLPVTAREGESPYLRVREKGYNLELLYRLAEMTATVSGKDIKELNSVLTSEQPSEMKFWATVAMAQLSLKETLTKEAIDNLTDMLSCGDYMVEQEAAYALCHTIKSDKAISYLASHPEMTSTLECLSLEPEMKKCFTKDIMDMLWGRSKEYEVKERKSMPNGHARVDARKVLVNLGLIQADNLYGPNVYDAGISVNKKRRPLKPTP